VALNTDQQLNTDKQEDSPVLLYNDECGVCRRLAGWVKKSATTTSGRPGIIERPIGDDPEALLALNSDLDIWDAYETIHLLMPDGSMKVGGEACAEVLRRLPRTRWFARYFDVRVFGFRPFQRLLDVGYLVVSDVRPVFGCESCGTPSAWLKPMAWIAKRFGALGGRSPAASPVPHLTGTPALSTGRPTASPRVD
jgi:predicted DCC family thiol-disulfide oxidoreductase YuxK